MIYENSKEARLELSETQIFLFAWTLRYFDVVFPSTLITKSNIQQFPASEDFKTSFQKPRHVMFQNWVMHPSPAHLGGRQEGMQPLLTPNPVTLPLQD